MGFNDILFSGVLNQIQTTHLAAYMILLQSGLPISMENPTLEAIGCSYHKLSEENKSDVLALVTEAYSNRLRIHRGETLRQLLTKTLH